VRIHRIRLRNYRGVTDVEVQFAEHGVTIVEGANEAGKTSLLEALDFLIRTLDSSTAQAIKAVQPSGRDVGAEVEAEISSGPYRFVYRKRWHRQRETTLEVVAPRREQWVGREAHERVEAILAETLDAALWSALRLKQGATLAQPGLDVPSLGRALDAAAGGDLAGDREDGPRSRERSRRRARASSPPSSACGSSTTRPTRSWRSSMRRPSWRASGSTTSARRRCSRPGSRRSAVGGHRCASSGPRETPPRRRRVNAQQTTTDGSS
jgi:hypothetical protein